MHASVRGGQAEPFPVPKAQHEDEKASTSDALHVDIRRWLGSAGIAQPCPLFSSGGQDEIEEIAGSSSDDASQGALAIRGPGLVARGPLNP